MVGIPTSPPNFDAESQLVENASKERLFCSFVNIENFREFNPTIFEETLRDWGYFGEEGNRPGWIDQES